MMSKKTECCGYNFTMSGKMSVEEIIDFVQTVLINLYWKIVSFGLNNYYHLIKNMTPSTSE